MNDSPYGLTASVWTNAEGNPESEKAFLRIVDQLETGTVFLNRCDEHSGGSTAHDGLINNYLLLH
jgi:acyl-CoA reductase-like NAD-dependent aldehyde dehydrogenase